MKVDAGASVALLIGGADALRRVLTALIAGFGLVKVCSLRVLFRLSSSSSLKAAAPVNGGGRGSDNFSARVWPAVAEALSPAFARFESWGLLRGERAITTNECLSALRRSGGVVFRDSAMGSMNRYLHLGERRGKTGEQRSIDARE